MSPRTNPTVKNNVISWTPQKFDKERLRFLTTVGGFDGSLMTPTSHVTRVRGDCASSGYVDADR